MKAIELLLNSGRGVYIPQAFAEECLGFPSNVENGWDFAELAAEVLLKGPDDNEEYWEAWEYMLDNARFRLEGGIWDLHHDGDLFAVNWDWMTMAERVGWRETLGMAHSDMYNLTGTTDDREVVEEYLTAIGMLESEWKWETFGYHSCRLSILNGDGVMGWRNYTFGADFQSDLWDACEFRKSQRARGF